MKSREVTAPGSSPGASHFWRAGLKHGGAAVGSIRRLEPVERYAAAVVALGVILLAAIALIEGTAGDVLRRGTGLYAALGGAVLIGELFPIRVRRGEVVHEITTSTTFAFALMLGWGTASGIAALVLASSVADIVQRKSPLKVAFNASQYAISLGVAGLVLHGFGGTQFHAASGMWPSVSELPLLLAAAGTFFVLNEILPSVAISLAGAVPVRQHVLSTLAFDAAVASALLAMAPVVVVLVDHSPLLLPMVAFPVVTTYVGARAMLRNIEVFESKNTELEQLNRLKDDFVAMVSHELRTPLTSIKGSVKTLVELGRNLPEQDRASLLEAVDRKSDHLHTLIERLLVVSQLEAGRQEDEASYTRVGLGAVCAEVLLDLKRSIGDRYFNVDFDPPLVEVETDKEKIHQAISNLVENALKYSYPRSDITLRCRVESGAAVFSVEDHGPGIPPAARERLFDRFYQVDQSRTREVGGIGLGLYISRSLARALGGELWLDENYSAGCRFCLRIPGLAAGIGADEHR